MTGVPSKILVPVDGSDNSFRAFERALAIAKSTGAQVTAVLVIETPPTVYVESQKLLDQLLQNFRKESAKVLDRYEDAAEKQGMKVESVVMEGNPATNVVAYGEKGGFDMIVMGSRGLGKFTGMVLGSTSRKVLQNANCPVLIVK
jgi:nucleotide-binding universal stress UspA family protein